MVIESMSQEMAGRPTVLTGRRGRNRNNRIIIFENIRSSEDSAGLGPRDKNCPRDEPTVPPNPISSASINSPSRFT
jgi:hypothetical protein